MHTHMHHTHTICHMKYWALKLFGCFTSFTCKYCYMFKCYIQHIFIFQWSAGKQGWMLLVFVPDAGRACTWALAVRENTWPSAHICTAAHSASPPQGKLPILPTDRSADQFSMFSSHAWTWSFLCALCLQYVTPLDTWARTSRHHWGAHLGQRQIYFYIWHTFHKKACKVISSFRIKKYSTCR